MGVGCLVPSRLEVEGGEFTFLLGEDVLGLSESEIFMRLEICGLFI